MVTEDNPVLLNTGTKIEETLKPDENIPFSRHDGNGKLWSVQEEIDISRYNFDPNESFINIDITSFMDEKIEEAPKNVIICNTKEESDSSIHNDDNEVEGMLEALHQDKSKLSLALSSINSNLCDGMVAKRAIEKSIADLYESMKYANDLLPCPIPALPHQGTLPLDISNDFYQASISKTQPLEDLIISNGEKEIYANSTMQAHGKEESENKGKYILLNRYWTCFFNAFPCH